jgi:hypothetical protein
VKNLDTGRKADCADDVILRGLGGVESDLLEMRDNPSKAKSPLERMRG